MILLGITIENRLRFDHQYFKTMQQSIDATKRYIQIEEIDEPKRVASCS